MKNLIEQNAEVNKKAETMVEPIGILALFHRKGYQTGTQRIVIEKADLLEIHNSTKDSKDAALGRIDYNVKKNIPLESNQDLSLALLNYLPHTQSWKMNEQFSRNGGFTINFDVERTGICTRQCWIQEFEGWKESSTQLQVETTESQFWSNAFFSSPTKDVLSPAQTKERVKREIQFKGLNQFFYGEEYVWALNKKNADRKAKSLGFAIV
jgi:hypothetical protein